MRKSKTPRTDAADKNYIFEAELLNEMRKMERECIFYRNQLELIAGDRRKTRGQRMASSALTFWDAIKAEEAAKGANE